MSTTNPYVIFNATLEAGNRSEFGFGGSLGGLSE